MTEMLANLSGRQPRGTRIVIYLILGLFVFLGAWSSWAEVTEVVRGTGRVAPRLQTQLIQNLEGGIVEDIQVAEGDIVDAGQLVARIDETTFRSAYQELIEQQAALEVRLARLNAERAPGDVLHLDADLHARTPDVARSEEELLQARVLEFRETTETLRQALELQEEQVELLSAITDSNALPRIELIRARQSLVQAQRNYSTYVHDFHATRSQEFSDALTQLRQVRQQVQIRQDQLNRTNLYSPVDGIVNRIIVTTLGGVVGPGEPIMEILPLDDNLRVKGRISPRDVGFVFIGMPATVKLTAFDFAIYGTLGGRVAHVGADTVTDASDPRAEPYYEVIVDLDTQTLSGPDDDAVVIRPGMQATLELEAGKKSILEYLLKPLFRATEAFSER